MLSKSLTTLTSAGSFDIRFETPTLLRTVSADSENNGITRRNGHFMSAQAWNTACAPAEASSWTFAQYCRTRRKISPSSASVYGSDSYRETHSSNFLWAQPALVISDCVSRHSAES